MTFRVGVLASGQGTNLQALIDAAQQAGCPFEIVVVGCNCASAPVLARARQAAIPVCVADREQLPRRAERQQVLLEALQAASVDLIVLAGFDEILSPGVVDAFARRIVNTHPSLLPAFGGTMHAVADALAHGVKVTGCTIHLVTDDLDAGPIVAQECVAIEDGDDATSLHDRIRQREHRLLPETVRAFAEGRVRFETNRVRVIPSAQ